MQKSKLLPSLLLTLASLVFLYSRVPVYMFPGEFIRPLIILWAVLLLLFLPTYWITRDWNWAGILLVVIVLGFFSSTIFAYSYSITVFLILVLLRGTYGIRKRKLAISHVFLVLNVVSLVAIFLSLMVLYSVLSTIPTTYYSSYIEVVKAEEFMNLNSGSGTKPDIYFIILDGYGRSDILQQLYGYDNSEFIAYLEQKGFTAPHYSRSNYPKTVLSVASTLNMDYIETFAPQLEESSMWWLMSPWIDHSRVRTSLEKIGYSSVSISTDWGITDNPTADFYFKSHPVTLSEFERYIFGVTPLKTLAPVIEDVASVPTFESHRRSQINNFDSLIESTAIPGPKFVFAHIILPHPPFVFSSDGSVINPDNSYSLNDASDYSGTPEQYHDQYVGQIEFLNNQLKPVIESILRNSQQPPIILLQADHGPGMLTDFGSAANTCLAERFSTFSAYYLPGKKPGMVPDDITSVNLFRVIFNEYFGADLPILENAQYYPRQGAGIYDVEEITDSIDSLENCSLR